jgi:hypothetical protein
MDRIIVDGKPFDPDEITMDAFAEGLDRTLAHIDAITEQLDALRHFGITRYRSSVLGKCVTVPDDGHNPAAVTRQPLTYR